jgi:hypothetical protein
LDVEFLYLDRTVCERCKGTEEILKEAVLDTRSILGPSGVQVSLEMTHVRTEEQALALGFVSSPTVRVMGRDATLDVRESQCPSCGNLSGCDITCRVWTWQGQEFSVPPKAMLQDAILRDAYLHPTGEKLAPTPLKELPENLKRFFRGVRDDRKQIQREIGQRERDEELLPPPPGENAADSGRCRPARGPGASDGVLPIKTSLRE